MQYYVFTKLSKNKYIKESSDNAFHISFSKEYANEWYFGNRLLSTCDSIALADDMCHLLADRLKRKRKKSRSRTRLSTIQEWVIEIEWQLKIRHH